jgi:hypothetical protein
MIANRTLIGHKCHHVIEAYAELTGVSIREAFDVFYKSNLYLEITGGISDMHCRSDGYLAEELRLEVEQARSQKSEVGSQEESAGDSPPA